MRLVHSHGSRGGIRMKAKRGTLAATVGLIVLAVAALRGRLRRYTIAERSMEPTLMSGDWTVARNRSGPPTRAAVIVFTDPREPERELVKRVVGLPGERLTITNGQVHIDGRVLAEPWADGPTLPDGEWTIGGDELFVIGDARARSASDSRVFGPIPAEAAEWRVAARYWPLRSIGRI